jgi:4-aminobutyrate aminotransferase-like enzyme
MLRGLVIEPGRGRSGPGGESAPTGAATESGADAVKAIMNACREQGLLVLKSGDNVVRLAPPLVISKKEIDAGVAILEKVLSDRATGAQGETT